MMKRNIATAVAALAALALCAGWKPAGDKLKTAWAEKIDVKNVLPEYPRPQMERAEWLNLNGLWEYAISPAGKSKPSTFDGEILVPFPVESSLSGVMKPLTPKDDLWYARSFSVPEKWAGKNVLLNFGAVDWQADVWVNGKKVGSHFGGYAPFSFDITSAIKTGNNILTVRAFDPSNAGIQPRGKQFLDPQGIVYTPASGIWQTVWLEPVNKAYIEKIDVVPDYDKSAFVFNVKASSPDAVTVVRILDGQNIVAEASGKAGGPLRVEIKNKKPWSPDSPFLYGVEASLSENGKETDSVKSYCAMRKFALRRGMVGKDPFATKILLNDKPLFHFGPLDQGYWPDGIYTAPTDEALKFDIKKAKALGFNMIRKHMKVEPARWYWYCDKIGMLVWQDMPAGWRFENWTPFVYVSKDNTTRSEESRKIYVREWLEIIDSLRSFPCIEVWTPFNESCGQFDTLKIVEMTKNADPTRLVDSASGGNFFPDCGDIVDTHSYPAPRIGFKDTSRACVVGEYGGIGYEYPEHSWKQKKHFGYGQFKHSVDEVTADYLKYAEDLKSLEKAGCVGAVYTQITDVEDEVNGLITYDREKMKVDEAKVRAKNLEVIKSAE